VPISPSSPLSSTTLHSLLDTHSPLSSTPWHSTLDAHPVLKRPRLCLTATTSSSQVCEEAHKSFVPTTDGVAELGEAIVASPSLSSPPLRPRLWKGHRISSSLMQMASCSWRTCRLNPTFCNHHNTTIPYYNQVDALRLLDPSLPEDPML
jgi:hypothetical protein